MIELMINKIEGYNYSLIDKEKNEYTLNLEFYDLKDEVKAYDKILMPKRILKQKNMMLNYGLLDNICGKIITNSNEEDLLVLITKNKNIYLKRLYG